LKNFNDGGQKMSTKKQLSARERMNVLLDDNSFVEIGALVSARATDFNMASIETPADGVITGYGMIDDKLVYVYSQDVNVLGGAVGEMHAKKITKIYDLAQKVGVPVIGMIDCAGMRLQEATDALNAFGELYFKQTMASGVILQVTAVLGTCGGGVAMIPALTDFTLMAKETGKLFVNTPNALAGNEISKNNTWGFGFQSEEAGSVDYIGEDDVDVLMKTRELVTLLPGNYKDDNGYDTCTDDLNRENMVLASVKDIAYIFKDISDNYQFFEVKADYAKEMTTGFIKLNGLTVGAFGNQTEILDDDGNGSERFEAVLTTAGALKAADFVRFCDAFGIPVLSLVNVKGFSAIIQEEKTIARASAKLVYELANATIPKVSLVIGKAFGSAYLAMNSKHIGADIVYAYPDTAIGMMEASMAVKIMYAKEIDGSDNAGTIIAEKAEEYDQRQTSPVSAAKRGYVDDIIEPAATRKRLIAAFEMLYTKKENRPNKKHGTV